MFNLLTIATCGACLFIGFKFGKKEKNMKKEFVLVEKKTGIGGKTNKTPYISLYFNGNTICNKNEINEKLQDANHFYVPVKGNELYINRTIFKDINLDGSFSYDHNGYYSLTNNEMKKAFKNIQKYETIA